MNQLTFTLLVVGSAAVTTAVWCYLLGVLVAELRGASMGVSP
ncbi:MAG: hypothetical protein ABEJ61_08625 [Haloferacaceae archaeon]